MLGTFFNVGAIIIGGLLGLARRNQLAARQEYLLKIGLAVFSVYYGLRLTCLSIAGPAWHVISLSAVTLVSLMLGKMAGRLLRLQKMSNQLGQKARGWLEDAARGKKITFGNAFLAGTILFASAPLGVTGAIIDSTVPASYPYPLVIKGIMDGLATLSFVRMMGMGVVLSFVPVLTIQGTIYLLIKIYLQDWLRFHGLSDPLLAVAGILVFCVALIILELKKVPLAEYLPALVLAPVATWLLRIL